MTNSFCITSCKVESFEQSSKDNNTVKVNVTMELKLQEKSDIPSYLGNDPFFSAWQNEPIPATLDQRTIDSLIEDTSNTFEFADYDPIGLAPTRLDVALNSLKASSNQTTAIKNTINETISSLERLKNLVK